MELTQKPLSKLTKPELIETVNLVQKNTTNLERKLRRQREESDTLQQRVSVLERENIQLKRAVRKENDHFSEADNVREVELTDLLNKHRALELQYRELLSNHNRLKTRLAEGHEQFDSLKHEFERLLEVKKSLTDNNNGYILVDYQYMIRFISHDIPVKLNSQNLFQFLDQKVFKLFDFDNGMRVKKQIDKVLVQKSHRSLKDAVCTTCDNGPLEFRSELHATRFRDKPAVLFSFK